MNSSALQLFLLLNAFLIGAAVAVAVRHAYAHYRPNTHDAEKARQLQLQQQVKLPQAVKEQLLERATINFEKILDTSASQLQLDLSKTTAGLNKQLETLGTQIVTDEMKRYRASLEELQRDTETAIQGTQAALDKHHEDLKVSMAEQQSTLVAKMNEEVATEKARLLAQIDSKLADATVSFLLETLQHNVDLGAQAAYLTDVLEQHKDEFKKEVSDETA